MPVSAHSAAGGRFSRIGRMSNILYRRDKDSATFASVPKFDKSPVLFCWRYILAVAGFCSVVAILAFVLHARRKSHTRVQQEAIKHLKLDDVMNDMNSTEVLTSRMKTTRVFQSLGRHGHTRETNGMVYEILADIHERCNPSLPKSELSFVDPDSVFTPRSAAPEDQCGRNEAEVLRAALDALDYSTTAVTPEPFMHAPLMEQVFRYFNHSQLVQAITHTSGNLHSRVKNPRLVVLVQFFAWGWPVEASELQDALGREAIAALQRCHLLMPCSKVPDYWISSLMMYPAPHTSAIVATDWGVRNMDETHEALAPTISLETLKLMHSGPDVRRKHVLDLSFNGGFQAIAAVQRGAASAVVLEADSRTVRITRFNAWLNGVGDKVQVDTLQKGDALPSTFDVLFGHGEERSLHASLSAGVWHLAPSGTFTITMDTDDPQGLAKQLCNDFKLSGFRGFISPEEQLSSSAEHLTAEAYLVSGRRTEDPERCSFAMPPRLSDSPIHQEKIIEFPPLPTARIAVELDQAPLIHFPDSDVQSPHSDSPIAQRKIFDFPAIIATELD